MANERFWNLDRISYFWGKIKSLVSSTANNKVDKVTGKGLSTNDYTDADQTALQTTLPGRISAIENAKGANSGYAELDANGKVPSSQLPSYVDDVEEYATVNDFPQIGETGKIYVATSTNITYRWGGSEYVPIGSDLALGETSSTAYRGDRGKAAYDHATAKGNAFNSGLYKITTNSEGHVTAATAVQKSDITALGIPGESVDISGKADKVNNATLGNFAGLDSNGNLTDSGHNHDDYLEQTYPFIENDMFDEITWSGFTSVDGQYIWTDGDNIYYSNGSNHYILNKETSTWSTKTWIGLTGNFYGNRVWTDGDNIYYSNTLDQYVLDKSTSTWNTKSWTGLTNFYGNRVWTDGDNIYYSNTLDQYVLDKSTSTWSSKIWNGLTEFYGDYIWTDGDNIYYSYTSTQYVLNKSTSTWSTKLWTGLASFIGNSVWTDGDNIYYSNSLTQYVLDKSTSTWSSKTWTGLTSFTGFHFWSDGDNIYYSYGSDQYVLIPYDPSNQILLGVTGEWTRTSLNNFKNLISMSGATASADGTSGLVPTPMINDRAKFLKGDGTWDFPFLLTTESSLAIPPSGESVIYSMEGLTSSHQIIRWNFSDSAENNPPASLECTTTDGGFTITNLSGNTSETIQPVFVGTIGIAIIARN